jgi:GxxExxY protein
MSSGAISLGEVTREPADPQTFAIIGPAMEVIESWGAASSRPVYHEALARELGTRRILFQSEVPLTIAYKGRLLATSYRADLICYDAIVVELKALRSVAGPEEAQVLNYFKASRLSRALLLNFGSPSLEYRRFVWTHHPSEFYESV